MPDWQIAVVFVAAHWAYQAWIGFRRRKGRTLPPMFPLVIGSVAVGAAIGDWWALALALAGLPGGIALSWNRERMRVREALIGTALDAAFIALGCAIHRLLSG